MNVTCPSCKARYSVDDARVPPSGVTIRCPSCSHTFVARRPTQAERGASSRDPSTVALPGQKAAATRPPAPKAAPRGASAVALPGQRAPGGSSIANEPTVPLPGSAAKRPEPPAPHAAADDLGGAFGLGTLDFLEDANQKTRHKPGHDLHPELRVRRRNGRTEGPYGLERLKAMLRAGDLGGSEDVSEDGSAWRAMTSVPELNAVMNELASARDAMEFGQVDLDAGESASIDLGTPTITRSKPRSRPSTFDGDDLDLGLEPDEPSEDMPPPPSGPSSMDELMGSLELDDREWESQEPPKPPRVDEPPMPEAALPDSVNELEVGEIPDMPPIWETYKRPILLFLGAVAVVMLGIVTHFFTPYGAYGVPYLVEVLTYDAPPPAPPPPPPPPPKLADLDEIKSLIDGHTYEGFRSAIATVEKAGPQLPDNALALAKARGLASLSYGVEAFPLAPLQSAVAALASVDPSTALEGRADLVALEKLIAQASLAVLEGEAEPVLPELKKASEDHPERMELALVAGAALERLERPLEALAAYDRAVVAAPGRAEPFRRIAALLEQMESEDAVIWYEKAFETQPTDGRSAAAAARIRAERHELGARRRALAVAGRAATQSLLPEARPKTLLDAVQLYETEGRISEVPQLAAEAARLAPGDAQAVSLAALSLIAQGQAEEAIRLLDPVIAREPASVPALVARARARMATDDVAKALIDLENALPHETDGEASMWLARFNRQLGKVNDAEMVLKRAARSKAPAEAQVELARLALATGSVDEAYASAKAATDADPYYAEAFVQLGLALSRRGQLDDAEKAYRKALELDDENPSARLGVANSLRDKAARTKHPERAVDLGHAVAMYLGILQENPRSPGALYEYGRVLELQGDLDGAILLYERATELDEKDVRPHLEMAAARLSREVPEVELAKVSLEKAQQIELASGIQNADVRYWEARLALAEGRHSDAVTAMRQATELEPQNALFQLWLGKALERNNSLFEAISAYERAIQSNSRLAEAHRALGRVALERHQFSRAREYFAKYLKFVPEDQSVWADIGESFSRQNKDGDALDAFQRALRADPDHARALLQVGLIESRRGNEKAAQGRFRRATRAQPELAEPWCLLGISLGQRRVTRESRQALERCLEVPGGPPDLRETAQMLLDGAR